MEIKSKEWLITTLDRQTGLVTFDTGVTEEEAKEKFLEYDYEDYTLFFTNQVSIVSIKPESI